MKRLVVTLVYKSVGQSGIDVPDELTLEEAIAFAKAQVKTISLPKNAAYIEDSDEIDEEGCSFEGTCIEKEDTESSCKNIILLFAFETGDKDCPYYQILVSVSDVETIDYGSIEDSLSSYIDCKENEDNEFETVVEDVMDASGLAWSFVASKIPESEAVHTFWV